MSNDSTVRWDITADFYCSYWCGFRPDVEIAAISVQHENAEKMQHEKKNENSNQPFMSLIFTVI